MSRTRPLSNSDRDEIEKIKKDIKAFVGQLSTLYGYTQGKICQGIPNASSTQLTKITDLTEKSRSEKSIWAPGTIKPFWEALKRKYDGYYEIDSEEKIIFFRKELVLSRLASHYLFYYWHENEIRIAELLIDMTPDNKRWRKVRLIYHYKQKNAWKTEDEQVAELSSDNETEIKYAGSILYITTSSKNTKTFFVIYFGNRDNKQEHRNLLFCSYATHLRQSSRPVAGIGILEKIDDIDSIDNIIKNNEVSPNIFNILLNRRKEVKGTETEVFPSSDKLPNNSEVKKLLLLKGKYIGYHLDSANRTLRTLTLEIMENGASVLKDDDPKTIKGYFTPLYSKMLIGTFEYNENEEANRLQFILEKKDNSNLRGIYGGYSTSLNPYSGIIHFERVDENGYNSNIVPKSFSKNEQIQNDEIRDFLSSNERISNLKKSFSQYSDLLQECITPELLFGSEDNQDTSYDGPVGTFNLFSSSSDKEKIVKHPISIESNGRVTMAGSKTIVNGAKRYAQKIYFKGLAKRLNTIALLINFELENVNRKDWKGTYLLYIDGGEKAKKVRIATGLSLRLNESQHPQAKREFLIESEEDFATMTYAEIYPNSQGRKELDSIYPGLFKSLFGREYNLMITKREINKLPKLIEREPFDRIYFINACFCFLKMDSINYSKYLQLALDHGLQYEVVEEEIHKLVSIIDNEIFILLVQNLSNQFSQLKSLISIKAAEKKKIVSGFISKAKIL